MESSSRAAPQPLRPALPGRGTEYVVGATYALPAAIATLHDTARPRGGLPLAVGVLPAAIIPMPAQRRARVVILLVGAIVGAPLLGGGVIAHLPTPHSGASSDLRRRGRGTRREGLVWQHRARAFSTASRRRVVIHGLRHLGPDRRTAGGRERVRLARLPCRWCRFCIWTRRHQRGGSGARIGAEGAHTANAFRDRVPARRRDQAAPLRSLFWISLCRLSRTPSFDYAAARSAR
jgi:hypothetical protein